MCKFFFTRPYFLKTASIVKLFDIEDAMYRKDRFSDVEKEFEDVQKITHCSTGCGECHDKIMKIIFDLMSS